MLIEESLDIDLTQTISLLKIRCPEILGKKTAYLNSFLLYNYIFKNVFVQSLKEVNDIKI